MRATPCGVRMSLDLHKGDLGMVRDHCGELVQEVERARFDHMSVSPEIDRVEDAQTILFDLDELWRGAAHMFGRSGLVRAVIETIRDAIIVAIGEGAALV